MERPPTDNALPGNEAKDASRADQGRVGGNGNEGEAARSPLDALARGLVAIGDKFRTRPRLRVL